MARAALQGFILAFGLILPLGVQNTFVFTQGVLNARWTGGLASALTAAVCDTLLITTGVSGVSLLVLTIPWFQTVLSWAGVVFLAYIGLSTWRNSGEASGETASSGQWPASRQIRFAASVSLLNPHAILDTVGVIGTGSLAYAPGAERIAYTGACVLVSWMWFLALLSAGHLLGTLGTSARWRRALSKCSAVLMWSVGLRFLRALIR